MTQLEAQLMVSDVGAALLVLPQDVPTSWVGAAATSCADALSQVRNRLSTLSTEATEAEASCKALDAIL